MTRLTTRTGHDAPSAPLTIGLARRGYSGTGGAEAYLKRFAEAIAARGHTPLLFGSPQWPSTEWPGGRIEQIDASSPRAFADTVRARATSALCDRLFSLERLWECDLYRAGDGVHRGWLERRAVVEPFWRRFGRHFNRKHRQLLEIEERLFSSQGAGQVIANSHLVRDEIIAHYGYPAERIGVVYNGLPLPPSATPQERARWREKLGVRPEAFVILFAGSGWERKGLAAAITAFRQANLPGATLLIAGRGERSRLPSASNLLFAGPVPGREMPGLYAAADLFILPTLYDPFSNASLEAFAAGLPVVTTRANGFAEIIRDGEEGSVVDHQSDITALAAALRHWADAERRAALRPRLIKRAKAFGIEANVTATLEVLLNS